MRAARAVILGCLLSVLLSFGLSSPAKAQVSCTLTGGPLAFGTLNVVTGLPAYASGTATGTCTSTIGFPITGYACLDIGTGTGGISGGERAMASGGNLLPFEVRSTPGSATEIGDGTTWPSAGPMTISLPATGTASVSFPVVAIVRPQGVLPAPGTYTSTFTGAAFRLYGTSNAVTTCAQANAAVQYAVTGSLLVTATVTNQCTVTASPLSFGTTSFMTANIDVAAAVTVTCNASTPVTVSLDNGSTGTGPTARQMSSGANRVLYAAYWNSARTTPAGLASNSQGMAGVANKVLSLPVYGRVPPQASKPPGSYVDTIGVTVSY